MSEISTKPYFLRAIYEWCTDNGFTPYIAVKVFGVVKVPMEFVRNDEIVLNVSFGATSSLKMDNEAIQFNARFGGVSREIYVPVSNVQAIYASENGQGMSFELEMPSSELLFKPEPVKPTLGLAPVSSNAKTEIPASKKAESSKTASLNEKKSEKPTLKVIK